MFDAYCKQTLRNALADCLRKKNYLNEHEIPTADMDLYIDTGNEITERSWQSALFIEFEGQHYPLETEALHKVLSTLSERYIGVLLLKYWHRMKDIAIAAHFRVSERTVRYWRRSAIAKIAVERGETNGEMKTARDKAETAQEEYEDFVHELASEQATSI